MALLQLHYPFSCWRTMAMPCPRSISEKHDYRNQTPNRVDRALIGQQDGCGRQTAPRSRCEPQPTNGLQVEPSKLCEVYSSMKPIVQITLLAMSSCVMLAGAAMASPSGSSNGAAHRPLLTIPNGGAKAISGVPIVLKSQVGTPADGIARQLMAREIMKATQVGEMPLVLVATARLGGLRDTDVLFVQLQSSRDCGSAGCDTVSFRHTNGRWVKILDTVSGTIRVAATRHRGMPDLIVQDTDRRIWDGEKYASTVPMPPAGLESPAERGDTGQSGSGRWT